MCGLAVCIKEVVEVEEETGVEVEVGEEVEETALGALVPVEGAVQPALSVLRLLLQAATRREKAPPHQLQQQCKKKPRLVKRIHC